MLPGGESRRAFPWSIVASSMVMVGISVASAVLLGFVLQFAVELSLSFGPKSAIRGCPRIQDRSDVGIY